MQSELGNEASKFTKENKFLGDLDFEFRNIEYSVKSKKETKMILKGINGNVSSGQVLAILGASGAGKSCLLNVLSGRIPKKAKATGRLTLNGEKIRKNDFKNLISYVPQEDLLYAKQTVRESILFSAKLRCPKGISDEECAQKTDSVIRQLGLTKSQDTPVGNQFTKGVSGGEKRRISIAIEVIQDTPILLLDEPTTGLDSFTAHNVVKHLSDLAVNLGRIIIFTIHQPRSNIFELFDKILLISSGQTVYFGEAKECFKYLNSIGFSCPPNFNYTDYLLRISSIDHRTEELQKESEIKVKRLLESFKINFESEAKITSVDPDDSENKEKEQKKKNLVQPIKRRKLNFLREISILLKRSIKEYVLNPYLLGVNILPIVIIGLLTGGVYYKLNEVSGLSCKDTKGALFFLVITQFASNYFIMIDMFFSTKPIFTLEYTKGYYSSFSFIAVSAITFNLMEPINTLILVAIIYPMIGLHGGFSRIAIFYFDILFTRILAKAMAHLLASVFKSIKNEKIISPFIFMIFVLLSGFYISPQNLPVVLSQLQYLVFLRYTYQIAIKNEVQGYRYNCSAANIQTGDEILRKMYPDKLGFPELFSLLTGFLFLFYIASAFFLWINAPKYEVISEKK